MTDEVHRHWFCFSFVGQDKFGHPSTAYACSYVGFDEREPLFGRATIRQQLRAAGLAGGVLLCINYLGFGTREEFDT